MQELEKILEEIKGLRGKVGSECTSEDHYMKRAWEHCLNRVTEIIRKHMDDGWIPVEERLPEDEEMGPGHMSDKNRKEIRKQGMVWRGILARNRFDVGSNRPASASGAVPAGDRNPAAGVEGQDAAHIPGRVHI